VRQTALTWDSHRVVAHTNQRVEDFLTRVTKATVLPLVRDEDFASFTKESRCLLAERQFHVQIAVVTARRDSGGG